MMRKSFGIVLVVSALLIPSTALAHGGGLDKNGCHTNRKTGDYHCHGSGLAAPRATPFHAASPPPALPAHKDLVKAAQALLQALHYDASLQGELDARTRSAITAFQRAEGLEPGGSVSAGLVLRLAQALAKRCR